MRRVVTAAVPFVAIGAAFTAVGLSGQKTLLVIGIAFMALGLVLLTRKPGTGGPT